jgi:TPR repeat protein
VKIRNGLILVAVFAFTLMTAMSAQGKPYPWEVQEKDTPASSAPAKKPAVKAPSEASSSLKAIYKRAVNYYLGKGVKKDYVKAFALFKEAADRGYAAAQHMAGVCYEYGKGTVKDLDQAFHYYLLSAKQGNFKAQFKVGSFYWFGKGRKRNFSKAVKWYSLTAKKGFGPALNNLGVAHENGLGAAKDPETALIYYEKAARKGNKKGYENLVRLSKKLGKPVPANIGGRVRLGIYDLPTSRKWIRVPLPDNKKEKQWLMGYVTKKGMDPNPLVLFRPDSFGYTSRSQQKKFEKKFIEGMKAKKEVDVQSVTVAGHKTTVVRNYDGKDTAFTLLPYDDVAFHLIIVMYTGKNVAELTPAVRSYLAAMVIRTQ